jgi:glutamate formiminotransferase / 5-formyltetrahydrofolate cyclo-ligase
VRVPTLLAVPNVSEGRDGRVIAEIGAAFSSGDAGPQAAGSRVRLLNVHSDADHHRSVFTLAAAPAELADALLAGLEVATGRIDVLDRAEACGRDAGQHPHVGAADVVPIVYLREEDRGPACAEALLVADRIADELEVPVFLYGELTAAIPGEGRTRAELRRGGLLALAARMSDRNDPLRPDFGPHQIHASAGATLVAARPPLVAFNLQLAPPATIDTAREIAARIRQGGQAAIPGLRAIGILLKGDVPQVSMNVERPFEVSLAEVVASVRAHATVASAELVGLAPAAAMEGFPEDIPLPGFDPARHIIENALG